MESLTGLFLAVLLLLVPLRSSGRKGEDAGSGSSSKSPVTACVTGFVGDAFERGELLDAAVGGGAKPKKSSCGWQGSCCNDRREGEGDTRAG